MSDVNEVVVQLLASEGGDPGRVTSGFYVIEGGQLIMTGDDGVPVDEYLYRHTLKPSDDAHAIAGLLTKQVRSAMRGETVPGFSNEIRYPDGGVA